MNSILIKIKNTIYDKCSFRFSSFVNEAESQAYCACRFKLNDLNIICRNAKITPKKIGQFVTFWKRNQAGITEALNEKDAFDFYVVNVSKDHKLGQFILPKSILIDKGILSSTTKSGKRGFRVYPTWDKPNNKQAIKTQAWQQNYFIVIDSQTDLELVKNLYEKGKRID